MCMSTTLNHTVFSSFFTSFRNTILFQIKVFGGKINEVTLAMHLKKITGQASFTQLRIS